MQDKCGRKIEYLRVSVTQNCNLKCMYCSSGKETMLTSCCASLTAAEFEIIISSMSGLGINKVRLTGGEPTLRSDIYDIIQRISSITGIDDISMTTNGILLDKMAGKLKSAGLKRLNISLDSLKPEKYAYMTGGGKLEDVLAGVKKAIDVGLCPVKINTVLVKGINDEEIDGFILFAKDNPVDVRFIELMPIGNFGEQNINNTVYNSNIIAAHPELIPCEDTNASDPAKYYRINNYMGKIGFISPMSHKFCYCCNRIRLTCDGKIKPCLGNNGETSILEVLRDKPENLQQFLREIIYNKPEGHNFGKGFVSSRKMNAIGG